MTASRVDSNQPEIVATLRGMGCSVQHLHAVGKGVPDLLVGCRGVNLLVEVKTIGGQLNEIQGVWHGTWRGQASIIRTEDEAVELVQRVWGASVEPGTHKSKWHGKGEHHATENRGVV